MEQKRNNNYLFTDNSEKQTLKILNCRLVQQATLTCSSEVDMLLIFGLKKSDPKHCMDDEITKERQKDMRLLLKAGLFNNKSRLLIVAKENQKNAVFRWTVPHWRKVFNYPNCFVVE